MSIFQVLVMGREGMNRSIHGDTVVVSLLPKRRYGSSTVPSLLSYQYLSVSSKWVSFYDECLAHVCTMIGVYHP